MGWNFSLGEIFGYGDSFLDFIFCFLKVFGQLAKLLDAAAAVGSHTVKERGYSYMIGAAQNFCLLDHVTGLFSYHSVTKLPSILKILNFWSFATGIVLDVELEDKKFSFRFMIFYQCKVSGIFFVQKVKTHKTIILVYKNLAGKVRNKKSVA